MYFDFVYGISVDTREKPTANRREPQIRDLLSASGLQPSLESALRARQSDLLILTLAIQLRCLARPFIGTVRANPVGAPAAPVREISIEQS